MVDEGVRETGDEVPLRHQFRVEESERERKKRSWRAKLKTAAQPSNQSYSFTFQAQTQREYSHWQKSRKHHRK